MGLNVGVVSFFFLFDARTTQTGIGFSCRLQPQEKEQRMAWGEKEGEGIGQGSEPRRPRAASRAQHGRARPLTGTAQATRGVAKIDGELLHGGEEQGHGRR
jgi:hypothetical protein